MRYLKAFFLNFFVADPKNYSGIELFLGMLGFTAMVCIGGVILSKWLYGVP